MRPAPRVPSKQVKAKTLPFTNLRASSAFSIPANAGTIVATAVTVPKIKRASMQLLQLTKSAGARLYPTLTIPTVATLKQVGWESLNALTEFLPRFDRGPGQPGSARRFQSLDQ